ncbi:MAG TPA: hypothetical protein VFW25_10325 [Silvibacterium sp.]|nr:hypothetical protein [Silvibacterium sp.]
MHPRKQLPAMAADWLVAVSDIQNNSSAGGAGKTAFHFSGQKNSGIRAERQLPTPDRDTTGATHGAQAKTGEGKMSSELQLLDQWIPEQMEPGTLFLLENAGSLGDTRDPYWAVLACPGCGSLGLITRAQFAGLQSMICGSDHCSLEYYLRGDEIEYRKPH